MNVTQAYLASLPPREAAKLAYAKYREAQWRCENIERRALDRFGGHTTFTKYQLKHASEYWFYRELCATRDFWGDEARTSAALAGL